MTAFAANHGRRPGQFLAATCLAIALGAQAQPASAADPVPAYAAGEPVTVHVDQAKILKLPERTATLVVGNPLIADVAVQPGGILVITAKSYGVTNLVALDRAGATLMEHPIQVVGANENIVVVFRGVQRESYSCMPDCERRVTLGDSADYFTANLTQTGSYSAQAQGQQQQQQK